MLFVSYCPDAVFAFCGGRTNAEDSGVTEYPFFTNGTFWICIDFRVIRSSLAFGSALGRRCMWFYAIVVCVEARRQMSGIDLEGKGIWRLVLMSTCKVCILPYLCRIKGITGPRQHGTTGVTG
jgi:hypothetical protein